MCSTVCNKHTCAGCLTTTPAIGRASMFRQPGPCMLGERGGRGGAPPLSHIKDDVEKSEKIEDEHASLPETALLACGWSPGYSDAPWPGGEFREA
eukprot:365336-Chlamydomonas_euryale.AAC.9